MNAAQLTDWLERYFIAWGSNDALEVEALFTPDAVYWYDAYVEPARGRSEIVRRWVEGGPAAGLVYRYDLLALTDDGGIAHWTVGYQHPDPERPGWRIEMDGVLLLAFAPDGRCTEHREWYARREVPSAG